MTACQLLNCGVARKGGGCQPATVDLCNARTTACFILLAHTAAMVVRKLIEYDWRVRRFVRPGYMLTACFRTVALLLVSEVPPAKCFIKPATQNFENVFVCRPDHRKTRRRLGGFR